MSTNNLHKLVLQGLLTTADPTTFIGETGILTVDVTTGLISYHDGTTPGGNPISASGSSLPIIAVSYSDQGDSSNDSVGTIGSSGIGWTSAGSADVIYSVTSSSSVTASGVITFVAGHDVVNTAGLAATGANGVRFFAGNDETVFVSMVYATNSSGTAYAAPVSGSSRVQCLAEGTMITLANGTYKPIEAITYSDDLLVWDFDFGVFAQSKPLWIKRPSVTKSYNQLVFSDGSSLRTVGQHRIFNKEAGAFTYPLTDATPIGTTTFNMHGKEVTLVDKGIVSDTIVNYNIITGYHMNMFAGGILTSNSFNNVYPIKNMKFVTEQRARSLPKVSDRFYYGMRMGEQTMDVEQMEQYVARMLANKIELA